MKLSVIALDYDGTIARDGQVEALVLEAVKEAQARGIVVILVTGRIMTDLRRVLPNPELFDAVVSENGAVLSFPKVPSRLLTHPPSQILLHELCALHVPVGFGDCIIEADAGAAAKILKAIRKLELPLVLQFNHGRVMVLPQGIMGRAISPGVSPLRDAGLPMSGIVRNISRSHCQRSMHSFSPAMATSSDHARTP